MPGWSPQWGDVRFDHAAAARLVAEAQALARQLRVDADVRATVTTDALADWRGRRAEQAEPGLRRLPTELDRLAGELRRLAADVEVAAAEARAEQARREDDRRRWLDERAREEETRAAVGSGTRR